MNYKFSEMSFKGIIKTILGNLGIFVSCAIAICGLVYGILSITKKNYSYKIFESKAELAYYSTKDDLVKCIDNYIQSVAETSIMSGISFVDNCDKYNIDIRFALAQAQIESHFATKGIAVKTRSAFNVLAYDGRSANDMIKKGHHYSHPDESIAPYMKLLISKYLVNGKTEMDMMENFVNSEGKRYASNPNYENLLRITYQNIVENTNINVLYSEYQKYKIICNK